MTSQPASQKMKPTSREGRAVGELASSLDVAWSFRAGLRFGEGDGTAPAGRSGWHLWCSWRTFLAYRAGYLDQPGEPVSAHSQPRLTGRRSECRALDRLIEAVWAGESRTLMVRGDPGVGKTALLDYLARQARGTRYAGPSAVAGSGRSQVLLAGPDRGPDTPRTSATSTSGAIRSGPPEPYHHLDRSVARQERTGQRPVTWQGRRRRDARVSALAGAGEVLVSQTVKDLVAGSGITFADRGTQELKGVPGEWRLYSVASA